MIQLHGDIKVPRTAILHWPHGSARLNVQHQPDMTFGILADVLAALSRFQFQYGYTEVDFDILGEGQEFLGSGLIARGSPSPSPDPLLLPLPANLTALRTQPHDPTVIRVRNTPITLTFSQYGASIPSEDFLIVVNQITLRIIDELIKHGNDKAIGEDINVKWRRALLIFNPSAGMTWGMLGTTIEGVTAFGIKWGWLSCDLTVRFDSLGEVGNGFIMSI